MGGAYSRYAKGKAFSLFGFLPFFPDKYGTVIVAGNLHNVGRWDFDIAFFPGSGRKGFRTLKFELNS